MYKSKIICTFECEELGKSYIIFTKNEKDSDGKPIYYVAYYEPNKSLTELLPVTDSDELAMADDVLRQAMES